MINNAMPIPNAKALIDGICELQKGDVPEHLLKVGARRNGTEFNPNIYFKVLTHIANIPNHIIDYIYDMQHSGGQPSLYSRRVNAVPFQFSSQVSAWRKQHDLFDYIATDGTPQGFFELVVFRRMASQFYLFWHACYDDLSILTTHSEIERLISNISDGSFGAKLTEAQIVAMRAFDTQPAVKLTDTCASVFYCTFSAWDGLVRQKDTFSRTAPHRLVGQITMAKVKYDCGTVF